MVKERVLFIITMLLLVCLMVFPCSTMANDIIIKFISISAGQPVKDLQRLDLNVQVPDGEEIKTVKIYLQDELIYETNHEPYLYLWDTTKLNDGIYTLRAVVETHNDIKEIRENVEIRNYRSPYGNTVYAWDFEEEPEGWGPGRNLTSELSDESAFRGNYAAKYSGTYINTTICRHDTKWGAYNSLGFSPISPNTKYYIETWVKIDKIDSDDYELDDIAIKLNPMIRTASGGTTQRLYSTMAYDFSKMGTWQKLWIEFETKPDAAAFYFRLDTTGPDIANSDKTIDIELYLDEVKIIEVTELTVQNEVMAFPNPFTDDVRFAYFLSEDMQIKAAIYDEVGRRVFEVLDGAPISGYNEVVWDGCDYNGKSVSSGIYTCVISQERGDVFVPIITGKLIKKS